MRWLAVASGVLVLVGCEPEPVPITGEQQITLSEDGAAMKSEYDPDKHVLVSKHRVATKELLLPGLTAADSIAQTIAEIERLAPELVKDEAVMASLRGDVAWVIIALPKEHEHVAPHIARVYQLRELEQSQGRRSARKDLR